MTRDEEAPDPILFDRRIVERNIKRGLITRKDYEKFLKALDDAKDKGVQGEEMLDDDEDDEPGEPSEDAAASPAGSNSHS